VIDQLTVIDRYASVFQYVRIDVSIIIVFKLNLEGTLLLSYNQCVNSRFMLARASIRKCNFHGKPRRFIACNSAVQKIQSFMPEEQPGESGHFARRFDSLDDNNMMLPAIRIHQTLQSSHSNLPPKKYLEPLRPSKSSPLPPPTRRKKEAFKREREKRTSCLSYFVIAGKKKRKKEREREGGRGKPRYVNLSSNRSK